MLGVFCLFKDRSSDFFGDSATWKAGLPFVILKLKPKFDVRDKLVGFEGLPGFQQLAEVWKLGQTHQIGSDRSNLICGKW